MSSSKSKRNNNKRSKGGVRNKEYQKYQETRSRTVVVPRVVVGAPDEVRVQLQYSTQYLLYAAGVQAARWCTNGLWDVDPIIGGRVIPYFIEWMSIYNFYKVIGYTVHVQAVNLDNIPITLFLYHTNADPGTGLVGMRDLADGPYGQKFMIANSAGNNISPVLKSGHSIKQIVGDRISQNADRYVGSRISNPLDLTYFGVSAQSTVGALTTGTTVDVTIRFDTVLFDRRNVTEQVFAQGAGTGKMVVPGKTHPIK